MEPASAVLQLCQMISRRFVSCSATDGSPLSIDNLSFSNTTTRHCVSFMRRWPVPLIVLGLRGHGTMAWLPLRVAYRKPEFPAHVNGSADEPTPTTRCEMGWSKSVSTLRCTRTRLCKSKMWLLLLTSPCRRRGAIKAGATPISGPPEQK